MCRNYWELIRDSVWNLSKFIQKESRILYTLIPIHLQNNILSPCSSSSTMSACRDLLLNECCFKHSQAFSQALSITAGLPMTIIVNPSLWCAVHPPQVKFLAISIDTEFLTRSWDLAARLHVTYCPLRILAIKATRLWARAQWVFAVFITPLQSVSSLWTLDQLQLTFFIPSGIPGSPWPLSICTCSVLM